MKKELLPVIIRMHVENGSREAVAFFPTLPGTNYTDLTSYAHVGQHGTASEEFMKSCIAPSRDDAAEVGALLTELKSIYENDEDEPVVLVERRRNHWSYSQMRYDNWAK